MSARPHFVVIGAQKSGTTALCHYLDRHPRIAISRPKEPMFFSREEALVHPHFVMREWDAWRAYDWSGDRDGLLARYDALFPDAAADALCGDGSTSYLPSELAARRIREVNPEAKIVAILRNPTDRAYSAYWHYVKSRVAFMGFEDHLEYESGLTLDMGEYEKHLRRWLVHFPKDRMLVLLFEEFQADVAGAVGKVCDFLGVDAAGVDCETPVPKNSARVPRSVRFQLWLNRVGRGTSHSAIREGASRRRLRDRFADGLSRWNLAPGRYPPMNERLRAHLDEYYRRMNFGLSELVDGDIEKHWF